MTRVLDTANGTALPAFYLTRAAGDADAAGNQVPSLAGKLVSAAHSGGVISASSVNISNYALMMWAPGSPFFDVGVLVINGTFSPICLAEDANIVHGASTPQAAYPSYRGKTHRIPPALPHPTKPGSYLVGFGLFGYKKNFWSNCCGALKFSAKEDGSGSTPAVAFWSHPSTHDKPAVSVAANLDAYDGSAQSFFDDTVGNSPQKLKSSDSDAQFTITASIGQTSELGFGSTDIGDPLSSVIVRIHTPLPDYTIVDGDTLGDIAEAFYQDQTVYPHIVRANPGKISNPDVIPSGLTLKMPDLV